MKVLITGAAGASAHQYKKKLNNVHVVLGDYAELPALMLKTGQMLALPKPTDASYVHLMLTLALDQQIERIYAVQFREFELLKAAQQLFNEYGITILSPADEIH